MANPTINISKNNKQEFNRVQYDNSIQKKVDAITNVFKLLLVDSESFDEKSTFNQLFNYIRTYDRILYSPLSNIIYVVNNSEESEVTMGQILTNIEKLVGYIESTEFDHKDSFKENENCLRDTKKAILKIWDHISLAQQQYSVLKQSDEEYQLKFEGLISPYKEDMTKDMSTQLLTIVSIFTALAFLVFGGISSLDSIFSVQGIPLLKLMCVGIVWGLCILNLIFVFLFCIEKMTKLNFKSTDNLNANIFEKYPVVWWTDLILLSLFIVCMWAYYIHQQGIDGWIRVVYTSNPVLFMAIGTIAIFFIIFKACKWLSKKTNKVHSE